MRISKLLRPDFRDERKNGLDQSRPKSLGGQVPEENFRIFGVQFLEHAGASKDVGTNPKQKRYYFNH